MQHVIMEIKARCSQTDSVRRVLKSLPARNIGSDRQIDTYFRVDRGRLKLREGRIEHALIYYERPNETGPRESNVLLYKPAPDPTLKTILSKVLGVDVVVEKTREIYFIENVKFHIDDVAGLGTFVEIEAIAGVDELDSDIPNVSVNAKNDRERPVERLRRQCIEFMDLFGIPEDDLLCSSYSDMIRELY